MLFRVVGYWSGFCFMVAGFTTPSYVLGVVFLFLGIEATLLGHRLGEVKER